MTTKTAGTFALCLLAAGLTFAALAPGDVKAPDPDIGKSFRVPYTLTQTNHWLVRVKINGKGPFNFLVDSGAPALYIGTETARAAGLAKVPEGAFWTPIERFDIEGGATLRDIEGRVEDPFQLVGMNALGLPGTSIDGILGYTILARFRLELDPTRDRMTWTRLDFEPKGPPVPRGADAAKAKAKAKAGSVAEYQAMQALGPIMKLMAIFIGKQPADEVSPRGALGMLLDSKSDHVVISGLVEGSPAAEAGLRAGDELVRLNDRKVSDLASAHRAVARIRPGDRVAVTVRRGEETIDCTLTAGEGF